jgi:hypothetical protein
MQIAAPGAAYEEHHKPRVPNAIAKLACGPTSLGIGSHHLKVVVARDKPTMSSDDCYRCIAQLGRRLGASV